jgi:hypothetical protein
VQFYLDGALLGDELHAAPYQVEWPTTGATNGAHTLIVTARDGAGHDSSSMPVIVNVLNDLAPPTVAVTNPAAGTVSGTVTIAATAGDDIGVTSVQFLLDGAPLGAALGAAPYQVEWVTTGATNGAHTITAVARDAAGRETTTSVAVVVANEP